MEKSRIVVTRAWPGAGRKGLVLLFSGFRVSVWNDASVQEMDGGDGCIEMCVT